MFAESVNKKMEFRKLIMTILQTRQQKRHRYEEQTFGLCGRRQGWNDIREEHWNMNVTICKVDDQCKFDAWSRALRSQCSGTSQKDRVGKEVGGGVQDGGHMFTHGWFMSMYGKNQYCKVIILQLKSIIFLKLSITPSNSATFRYFGALLLGVYNCSIFLMYLPLYNYEISQTSLICLILFIATPVLFGYSLHDIFFTSSVFESKVALL